MFEFENYISKFPLIIYNVNIMKMSIFLKNLFKINAEINIKKYQSFEIYLLN